MLEVSNLGTTQSDSLFPWTDSPSFTHNTTMHKTVIKRLIHAVVVFKASYSRRIRSKSDFLQQSVFGLVYNTTRILPGVQHVTLIST